MECKCKVCGMGVKGLTCSKCDASLTSDRITKEDNQQIQVAKCPNGCGQIKSPQCCGQDMVCSG